MSTKRKDKLSTQSVLDHVFRPPRGLSYSVGEYNIPLKFKKSKHLAYMKMAGESQTSSSTASVSSENNEETASMMPKLEERSKPELERIKTKTQPTQRQNTFRRHYNIENVKNALEVLNENYDTFRTIFKAPDDISVNYEIQQEAAGLILDLLNPKLISNPIIAKQRNNSNDNVSRRDEYFFHDDALSRINKKLNKRPWMKTYADMRRDFDDNCEGFDEETFEKHRGKWKDKNIEEFKELFDD